MAHPLLGADTVNVLVAELFNMLGSYWFVTTPAARLRVPEKTGLMLIVTVEPGGEQVTVVAGSVESETAVQFPSELPAKITVGENMVVVVEPDPPGVSCKT